ncbi:MAG: hypothetical protein ACREAM_28500 [Blastocatellia bacterium]
MISSYSRASLAIVFLLSAAFSVERMQDAGQRGGRKPSEHSVSGLNVSGNAYGVNQTLPSGRYPSANLQIKNNVIEGNTRGAISAEALYASAITGNYFENMDIDQYLGQCQISNLK